MPLNILSIRLFLNVFIFHDAVFINISCNTLSTDDQKNIETGYHFFHAQCEYEKVNKIIYDIELSQ